MTLSRRSGVNCRRQTERSVSKMIKDRNIAPDAAIAISKVMGGGFVGVGRIMYVAPAASEQYSYWSSRVPVKDLFTTIAAAYAQVVSNRNDVVILSNSDAHAQTTMLTFAKNRWHLVGSDQRAGLGFGARSRITMASSTVAADIALMQNTGVGVTFSGIKFDSSSTEDLSLYAVAEGGEYTVYQNCEFYKSTDLDETTAAELLHNGDGTQYINCTFGSLANEVSTAIIRPCVTLARETIAGKFSRGGVFQDCLFHRYCGGTANAFVDATGVNDVGAALMFRDCDFLADELGSVPAEAVTSSGGKQERGIIALRNCTAWNCTLLKEASVGIHVSGPSVTHATAGIAKDA